MGTITPKKITEIKMEKSSILLIVVGCILNMLLAMYCVKNICKRRESFVAMPIEFDLFSIIIAICFGFIEMILFLIWQALKI